MFIRGKKIKWVNGNIVYAFSNRQSPKWGKDDIVLLLNIFTMSRKKQNQNIDNLINNIQGITKNRCSLSDEDIAILNEAISLLQMLKRKKGKTNKEILEVVVKVVELVSKFFA